MKFSRGLVIALTTAVVLTLAADFFLNAAGLNKAKLWGGKLPAYWAVFGLVWYLIIVGFSKLLGRYWLERSEDYYDGEDRVDD